MSLSGVFTGVLSLAALEVFLDSPLAVKATGGAATTVEAGVKRFLSPTLGLIPNLHDSGAPTSVSTSSTSGAGQSSANAAEHSALTQITKALGPTTHLAKQTKGVKPVVAAAPATNPFAGASTSGSAST